MSVAYSFRPAFRPNNPATQTVSFSDISEHDSDRLFDGYIGSSTWRIASSQYYLNKGETPLKPRAFGSLVLVYLTRAKVIRILDAR